MWFGYHDELFMKESNHCKPLHQNHRGLVPRGLFDSACKLPDYHCIGPCKLQKAVGQDYHFWDYTLPGNHYQGRITSGYLGLWDSIGVQLQWLN